jgi:penicillin-binding protein 2
MTEDFRQRKVFQDYAREARLRRRLGFLRVLVGCVFLTYLGTLWYYQVMRGAHYRELSDSNAIRSLPVAPLRGTIADRTGQVLARNRPSFTVVLSQVDAATWSATRDRLAALLGLDPTLLEERRRRAGARLGPEGIVVQEDVDLAQAATIESHPEKFPGVVVRVESRRAYEGGRLAAHLVGYVGEVSPAQIASREFPGSRSGDVVGKDGLERRFNADLSGQRGARQVIVNALGREIDALEGGEIAVPGASLELALDLDMQRTLIEAFGDHRGSAVFFDPRNGEVLALASMPAFDPNLFAGRFTRREWEDLARNPSHPLQNRATQSRYSAGSTFKIIVAAAALESGVITPSTRVNCPGYAVIYGRRFGCHLKGGHGSVDVHDALVKSCNVFFYQVGKSVGIDRIADYARRLGLGAPTGIDLFQEDEGLVPDDAWSRRVRGTPWYPGETISVSIGQGPLLVTSVQLAALAGAIGTGEFQPLHVVRRIGGRDVTPAHAEHRLDISESTLEVIRSGLWGVVNEAGTGRRAQLPNFPDIQVAGKTGTVQVVTASAGVDSAKLSEATRDHGWFVGWAPYREPTIAFAVFVEHGGHGGIEAAPIASQVLETYFGKQRRATGVRVAQG